MISTMLAMMLWMIGLNDQNYAEFGIPGNYPAFTETFPQGVVVDAGQSGAEKGWSYIQPGPGDAWAGARPHTFTIKFDGPQVESGSAPVAYMMTVQGWSQGGSPPRLMANLNGEIAEVQTNRGDERVLTSPAGIAPGLYSFAFPAKAVREQGNVLTITTASGSWFIYDFIGFSAASSSVDALSIAPGRGVLRLDDPNKAGRPITIGYAGNFLPQEGDLFVSYSVLGKDEEEPTIYSIQAHVTPDENIRSADVVLPVDLTDAAAPLSVEAKLVLGDKTIEKTGYLGAERPWEVNVIHQTHLDIGYTHTQVEILERQVQAIKDSLIYIEETRDYPPEAQFKFHPEGMWAIDEFLRRAAPEEKEAFIKATKAGEIHIDAMYSQAMTGLFSEEELFELLGNAIRFGREHGFEVTSAMQTDVPGYTWGLVPALAKSGIKYMTMGPNGGHRVGRLYYWGERPFYWQSPSGKEKVLCYLADTGYHQFHGKQLGHRLSEDEVFNILAGKEWYAPRDVPRTFPYDMVPLRYGIEGDNGRPNRVLSDVVKEWNEKYIYPKLIITTNSAFMKEFEQRYGDQLPTISGDYTPYWEDGAASTSEATAKNRIAKSGLLNAEKYWAIFAPEKFPEAVNRFDAAWVNVLMYDEHTWGAFNSIAEPDSDFVTQQDDYKQNFATQALLESQNLLKEVSNDYAVGKLFADLPLVADANAGTISNGIITVSVDKNSGAISSLKLVGCDHEFVNSGDDGNRGLNDYLCILGRDAKVNRFRVNDGVTITADNNFVPSVIVAMAGQVPTASYERTIDVTIEKSPSAALIIKSKAQNCNELTRFIVLEKGSDCVKVVNLVDKVMDRQPEGIFFGFPFNIPDGQWRIDTPWATVRVEKDQLPGANRNYYCVQNFCSLAGPEFGVDLLTPTAPLMQFAPIRFAPAWDKTLEYWREHIYPGGTIYSWVCNNHWETNYKAGQEGMLGFTYTIRPYRGGYNEVKSQKFARRFDGCALTSFISPLTQSADHAIPAIVETGNDNVLITRLKPCREYLDNNSISPYGPGLFVRLYNPTDEPQTVDLSFFKGNNISWADRQSYSPIVYLSNPWEDRVERISAPITIAPRDMIAIRVE